MYMAYVILLFSKEENWHAFFSETVSEVWWLLFGQNHSASEFWGLLFMGIMRFSSILHWHFLKYLRIRLLYSAIKGNQYNNFSLAPDWPRDDPHTVFFKWLDLKGIACVIKLSGMVITVEVQESVNKRLNKFPLKKMGVNISLVLIE